MLLYTPLKIRLLQTYKVFQTQLNVRYKQYTYPEFESQVYFLSFFFLILIVNFT